MLHYIYFTPQLYLKNVNLRIKIHSFTHSFIHSLTVELRFIFPTKYICNIGIFRCSINHLRCTITSIRLQILTFVSIVEVID